MKVLVDTLRGASRGSSSVRGARNPWLYTQQAKSLHHHRSIRESKFGGEDDLDMHDLPSSTLRGPSGVASRVNTFRGEY